MDDFGVESGENGGLFLAIFFGVIGMLTLGVTASSLELYHSINAVQFDGIGVYFYLFGVFPVEVTRETQAGIARSYYEITVVTFLFSLILAGLTTQQLFLWRHKRKAEHIGERLFD